MKPLKTELDAMREVLLTDLSEFITDKEAESRTEEKATALAQTRMFTQALEAVDRARAERRFHMVILRFGRGAATSYLGFGPYATDKQAETAVAKLLTQMDFTAYAVVPCRNPYGLDDMIANADAEPVEQSQWVVIAEDAAAFRKGWRGKQANRAKYVGG